LPKRRKDASDASFMSVEMPVKRSRLVRFDVHAMTNTVLWDGKFVDCDSVVGIVIGKWVGTTTDLSSIPSGIISVTRSVLGSTQPPVQLV
jgi:hypothetical protein